MALILLSPGLALATSGWGQIDSLLCLLIVLAFYFGWNDRFWLSTPLILAAVLTKPQEVLALGRLPFVFFQKPPHKKLELLF